MKLEISRADNFIQISWPKYISQFRSLQCYMSGPPVAPLDFYIPINLLDSKNSDAPLCVRVLFFTAAISIALNPNVLRAMFCK